MVRLRIMSTSSSHHCLPTRYQSRLLGLGHGRQFSPWGTEVSQEIGGFSCQRSQAQATEEGLNIWSQQPLHQVPSRRVPHRKAES